VNYKNYETVLDELREYLSDMLECEFVKKCIGALGKIAVRYEKSVDKCLGILAWQVKEVRSAVEHTEQVVNEILIVTVSLL
jgi:vesicle coat complex subunit